VSDLASPLVKTVILPPSSLFLLAAIGCALRRRLPAVGYSLAVGSIGLLYALSTPLVGRGLLQALETDPPLAGLPAGSAQAIVVLGGDVSLAGPEYGGATVGPLSLERTRYAAQLQRRTGLPVLVTGGRLEGDQPAVAAAIERALRVDFGVPVRWVEDQARNTMENATLSASILRQERIDSVIIVTHAWHMPRAKLAFAAAGLHAVPAPTGFTSSASGLLALVPDAKALAMSAYAVHEFVGLLWYRLYY
jgi:uncharacterized SAM-binding protein YcdF (DUF218 family)